MLFTLTAKSEETEEDIPLPSTLNNTHNPYPIDYYYKMEIEIMQAFGWRVSLPTVSHFW